jgi:hypothetical protein
VNIFEMCKLADFSACDPLVWQVTHRLAAGMPLTPDLVPVAERITGHAGPWRKAGYRRVVGCAGRGAQKTDNGAAILDYGAVFKNWRRVMRPGRTVWMGLSAQNREAAANSFEAALALLHRLEDALRRRLIDGKPQFTNDTGIIRIVDRDVGIRVVTRDPESARGWQWGDFVIDEAGAGAVNDISARSVGRFESTIRPRVAGDLWLIGTPSGQLTGPMFRSYERDRHPDATTLYVSFPTWEGSPEFDARNPGVREEIRATDPVLHDVEFGAQWLSLEGSYLDLGAIQRAVRAGPVVREPEDGRVYFGVVDLGFKHDSSVLLIGSHAGEGTARIDFVLEIIPPRGTPLVPRDVIDEFAAELDRYGVSTVAGDAYYEQTAVYEFAHHKITYEVQSFAPAEKLRFMSALRAGLLEGKVELPPEDRLIAQLRELRMTFSIAGTARFAVPERRGHDDLAIACAVLVARVLSSAQSPPVDLDVGGLPDTFASRVRYL